MKVYITWHANLFGRNRTPFISATWDLLRVFNIAGQRVLEGKEQVAILLIDPWRLSTGSYLDCNTLGLKSGLQTQGKYETEVLLGRKYQQNPYSVDGLGPTFVKAGCSKPCHPLEASKRQLKLHAHRQDLLCDRDTFSPSDIATSLASLGMDPSSFAMKQIFEFLLGQVWGHHVPTQLRTIEQQLIIDQKSKMDEFDHTAHSLAVTTGKNKRLIYFQQSYALDIGQLQPASDPWGRKTPQELRREWRKSWAARINELFCPDFETWWVRREESDLTDWEAQEIASLESCGIRSWM